jgi:hypothetical protein
MQSQISFLCRCGLLALTFALVARPCLAADADRKHIDIIVADGPAIPHWERLAAIDALSTQIDQANLLRLYAFLRSNSIPKGLQSIHVLALKDELLNVLEKQANPPRELAGVLIDIFNNQKQNALMRDYALQHMAAWYSRASDKAQLLSRLWTAAQSRENSLPGTALLSLWRISQENPRDVDLKKLAGMALDLASDSEADVDGRLSALQLCGQLGWKDALPVALTVAKSDSTPPNFRMAAIATIGDLGTNGQIATLESIETASSHDSGTATAAKAAIKEIKAKP